MALANCSDSQGGTTKDSDTKVPLSAQQETAEGAGEAEEARLGEAAAAPRKLPLVAAKKEEPQAASAPPTPAAGEGVVLPPAATAAAGEAAAAASADAPTSASGGHTAARPNVGSNTAGYVAVVALAAASASSVAVAGPAPGAASSCAHATLAPRMHTLPAACSMAGSTSASATSRCTAATAPAVSV